MSLLDLTVKQFIDEVDSSSPAPGGGSVSALASSLGIGLAKMVTHLTVGRKKFLGYSTDIQNEYQNQVVILNQLKEELIECIDKDTEAFNKIMEAIKMPKEEPSREQKLIDATKEAIHVPYKVTEMSLKALETCSKMIEYGNKNALSDIGVAALLLYSGIEGAVLNIKINLSGINEEDYRNQYQQYCKDVLMNAEKYKADILQYVYNNV